MMIERVKNAFMRRFEADGYQPKASAPLVIPELHTTFVMSVGLLQLKSVLTPQSDPRRFPAFCMIQRCLRHFDIETTGTANHLSFFEMAGAISSGDRSQSDVLKSVFEFLTDDMAMDPSHLLFSTFAGGQFLGQEIPADEASREVLARLGVPAGRLLLRGAESNFFGNTARDNAYGPSVEVYLDRGRRPECPDVAVCAPGCVCQRYVEVGTCVFLKYLRNNGSFRAIPRAFCEAGVGVERLAFTASGLDSIHQLRPLRDVAVLMMERGLLAKSPAEEDTHRANICADHLRGAVFAIADGARPGGNGRDHLLRTLIRRFLARCDWHDGRIVESLPALVNLVARGNRHILDLPAGERQAICGVLAAEAAFFLKSLLGGKIGRDRYLRRATR